ncbi:hypothetical protein BTH42_14380 [Burkholderia sp. SRS-W-2-2016]|uniref:thermonuclease family protein n=1 Tax=Burkholderia sp. SRS-W-2-2016 TaxID=1926878 RepID=UPI00094B4629|nr:hypothetical protein [Burkholderia sp. SRS-W-2-2016]OLL30959.1 hypothetical protein BTH42_14380 [Burkholderia sp. SRS-W-2-2016]
MVAEKKSRYTVVKGKYWIHNAEKPRQGPQPDGDTVAFIPDSPDVVRQLRKISGRPADIHGGRINVRYEGVDALETHFVGVHQQLALARAARDRNLQLLGFTNVRFFEDLPNVVESVDQSQLPGFVLANGIEANGRLLGLVYAGGSDHDDGEGMFVETEMLDQSVNAKLVVAGLVYVEPYDSMPMSLVRHLRAAVHCARKTGAGLFPQESITTEKAAVVQNLGDAQALVMWPKLFRRLATFLDEGHVGLDRFDEWIRDDPVRRDDTLRLPDGEKGNMHDTFTIVNNALQLRFRPEDLLITPDPTPVPH